MSQKDVELVRRAWGADGWGLEEVASTYWHPDVEYVEDPRWPGASRYRGRDAVLACFRAYQDTMGPRADGAVSVERVLDAGDRQVALVRFHGRSTSGVPHEHLWGYEVRAKDGLIVYFRAYYEAREALKAVGLEE